MRHLFLLVGLLVSGTVVAQTDSLKSAQLKEQVRQREIAFAQTMADRKPDLFMSFVSEEAVFLNDGDPLVGKKAIAAHWMRYFEGEKAPFSWKPDQVEVSGSGTLGQTTGPVYSPEGKLILRFYSTWKLEPDGVWRIVFDNGYMVCE